MIVGDDTRRRIQSNASPSAESTRKSDKMPGKKFKDRLYSCSQWLVRVVLRILYGCRYKGKENIPSTGPLIIASNHCSYCDPMSVGAGVPRPIHFMAKRELFKNPLFGGLIRYYNAVPIRRSGMDWQGVETLKGIIQGGGALIMFPQGTRRAEGTGLGKPKFGVGMFAQETRATIVPAFLIGTGRLKDAFLRRCPMRVYYGKPIQPEEYESFAHDPRGQLELAELVMERIEELVKTFHPEEYIPRDSRQKTNSL